MAALLVASAPAAAQTACDPTQTPAQLRGQVPKLQDVVPSPGGENGEVTTDQAYAYMDAVDRASERVITGALPRRSWQGRELRWAIVGHADRLSRRSLNEVAAAAQTDAVQRSRGRVAFLIANPRGLSADQHPFAGKLPRALERADVATIALRAP